MDLNGGEQEEEDEDGNGIESKNERCLRLHCIIEERKMGFVWENVKKG